MTANEFREKLLAYFDEFGRTLTTNSGDWVAKGFIDVYRNIYTISVDTKVTSDVNNGHQTFHAARSPA